MPGTQLFVVLLILLDLLAEVTFDREALLNDLLDLRKLIFGQIPGTLFGIDTGRLQDEGAVRTSDTV